MNRKIYIAFAAALTMFAACSEHPIDPVPQVPDSSHSYIFFEPEVVETVATRAAFHSGTALPIPTGENDHSDEFGVLGYYNGSSLFSSYTNPQDIALVYRAGSDFSYYTYDNLAIWQKETTEGKDNAHHFFAFYPYSIYGTVQANGGSPQISYTLPSTEDDMVDILTAYQSHSSKVQNVGLEFYHRLWALDFVIANNQTNNPYNPTTGAPSQTLSVVSAKITLKDVPGTGTLSINEGRSVSVASRKNQIFTLKERSSNTPTGDVVIDSEDEVCYGPLLLFPTDVTSSNNTFKVQYRIDMELRNPWGTEYKFSYPATEGAYADFKTGLTSFEAGKRYSLKVTKGNGENFTVSVNENIPWDGEVDVDHTFN